MRRNKLKLYAEQQGLTMTEVIEGWIDRIEIEKRWVEEQLEACASIAATPASPIDSTQRGVSTGKKRRRQKMPDRKS